MEKLKEPRRHKWNEIYKEVVRLHLADYSYREIQEITGIGRMTAFNIIRRKLGKRRKNSKRVDKSKK